MREDASPEIDGLAAVPRLAGDVHLLLGGDEGGEAAAHGGVFVGDDDANHSPKLLTAAHVGI